jgi:thymidine kinase
MKKDRKIKPFLKVHTGTMFAGKTEGLLADLRKHQIAGREVILFKPAMDDRFSQYQVVSHNGNRMDCVNLADIMDAKKITADFGNIDVIGFDEAQFFNVSSMIEVVEYLLDKGHSVIVAGLDMDYQGRPFGSMPMLMAMAEEVIKYSAVCFGCGGESHFEVRLDDSKDLVQLGGSESYISLCRSCRKEREDSENRLSI